MKQVRIEMTVLVPTTENEDTVMIKLLEWTDNNKWVAGGKVVDISTGWTTNCTAKDHLINHYSTAK